MKDRPKRPATVLFVLGILASSSAEARCSEPTAEGSHETWASPRELRGKKFIGGGLYTTNGGETAVTPRFLATHPEFVDSYPFDGIVVPAVLSPEWVASLGLTKRMPGGKIPWQPGFLHLLMWNTVRIPDEAVAQTISDLKAMYRGHLTDNFLLCGMTEGTRGRYLPDFSQDADWAILEHNARLAARVCREGKLKGFWLDTEQYTQYQWPNPSEAPGSPEYDPEKPPDQHFPLGRDTPEVLRRRGTQWIKAVQAEFPEVKIMTTFAWSPDSQSYGPLIGAIPFLDGILEGMETPGEIIHGHENTFYFGQGPGTTHAYAHEHGIPGDRSRYESRTAIRGWRALSSDSAKYDSFVKVGMAAWVEDHPWGVRPGFSIGDKASLWSNLPLALAYSDEYVWIWAEKTDYGLPRQPALNPFLASVANQTFNTNQEAVATFAEDFATDPLRRGWYFDFDMLAIGKKVNPEHAVPLMSTDTVPYVWSPEAHALLVKGDNPPQLHGQRRRFVRPLSADALQSSFSASIDFRVEAFGSQNGNPMVLGLFQSDLSLNEKSITLQIESAEKIKMVLASNGQSFTWPLTLPEGMKSQEKYRLTLEYHAATRTLRAKVTALEQSPNLFTEVKNSLPAALDPIGADELGIALFESPPRSEEAAEPYRYRVERVVLQR